MAAKIIFNADEILKGLVAKTINKASLKLKNSGYLNKLGTELEKVIDKEIEKIFPFIATHLIGIFSPQNLRDTVRPFSSARFTPEVEYDRQSGKTLKFPQAVRAYREVEWKPLSRRTTFAKKNNRFFEDTLKLKKKFLSTDARAKLGGAKVQRFQEKLDKDIKNASIAIGSSVSATVLLGYMTINIFGKISSYLPKLYYGDYDPNVALETRLFGADYGNRLRGYNPIKNRKGTTFQGGDYNRPLVQPTLTYYIATVIPNAIARSILRRNRDKTK